MFPDFSQLGSVADKLGDAATDIASRVESIETLMRLQCVLLAQIIFDSTDDVVTIDDILDRARAQIWMPAPGRVGEG